MKRILNSLNIIFVLFAFNILVYFLDRPKAFSILSTAKGYLVEMLTIMPPILILIGLFEVWVPRTVIERTMGRSTGMKGILFAILIGTAAMGPLYVAFPIGLSLLRKGASLFNATIFLCVWASIKIPMILFEIKFLGEEFAFLRLALTIPSILLISLLTSVILEGSVEHESL